MKKLQGFTLIELIVVIIILGMLAAVALPRFVNLQHDSRVAKLNAAKGAAAGSVLTVQVTGGTAAASCSFTCTAPAVGVAAIIGAPVTTGC